MIPADLAEESFLMMRPNAKGGIMREMYSILNFGRGVWLRRLLVICLMLAICPSAIRVAAQDKSKKLPPPSKPFDINTGTFDQFHSLPGVGPVTAQRILDYRKKSGPFTRVEDLLAVRGISQARLDKIKQYVMVKTPAPAAAAPAKSAPAPPKKSGSG
jgi:competence ComEA-like helix-hairpin-helix protein